MAIALAAVGVRLNASKSYYVRSPWATDESTMSFVALEDANGILRKQAMKTVDPAGAARYLGVWFSFMGPADGEYGRWSAQVARLQGITQKSFKT